jgi:hypothetical protein
MHLNIIIFSMMPLETLFDFSFRQKIEAVQVFIKTEEEEEEKEDVLMDNAQSPSDETFSTEATELER